MAANYNGSGTMSYSNNGGCYNYDGGPTMYSNTTEDCYHALKHSHGHGHNHGYVHGHGHGMNNMCSATATDERYDAESKRKQRAQTLEFLNSGCGSPK